MGIVDILNAVRPFYELAFRQICYISVELILF
jgi:hypothetical protein